jgi:hypothetical protein
MKLSGFFILCLSLFVFSFTSLATAEEPVVATVSGDSSLSELKPDKASSEAVGADKVAVGSSGEAIKTPESSLTGSPAKILGIKKELFYKCVRGKELRWMRLNYLKNGKCKTVYSKEGNAKEVSKEVDHETCETILKNIKKNLESGGYSCEEKILMGALDLDLD